MILVLSVTWDTTVSERFTASIFMVDGVCIFFLNDDTYLPDYVVSNTQKARQLSFS